MTATREKPKKRKKGGKAETQEATEGKYKLGPNGQKLPDLTGRKIMIATPAYSGMVCTQYCNALANSSVLLSYCGAEVIKGQITDSGSVPRTRNMAQSRAAAMGCTDLFFVDADMGWRPEDMLRFLMYDTDIVAAAYPARSEKRADPWIVVWPDKILRHDATGLLSAFRVGTGFVRIRMNVFEKLKELHPELHFAAPHTKDEDAARELYNFFTYQMVQNDDGTRGNLSEDYHFCDLVRDAGFTIWVDPNTFMEHVGRKVFSGIFSDEVKVKDAAD